jgi:hypothetical protein
MKARVEETIVILFCLTLMPYGCCAPKKTTSVQSEQIAINEARDVVKVFDVYEVIDTSRLHTSTIHYYRIQYRPDSDSLGLQLIDYIEGFTVSNVDEQTNIHATHSIDSIAKVEDRHINIVREETTSVEPAPDPYRWRYILGIVIGILIAGVMLWLKFR